MPAKPRTAGRVTLSRWLERTILQKDHPPRAARASSNPIASVYPAPVGRKVSPCRMPGRPPRARSPPGTQGGRGRRGRRLRRSRRALRPQGGSPGRGGRRPRSLPAPACSAEMRPGRRSPGSGEDAAPPISAADGPGQGRRGRSRTRPRAARTSGLRAKAKRAGRSTGKRNQRGRIA